MQMSSGLEVITAFVLTKFGGMSPVGDHFLCDWLLLVSTYLVVQVA